jgi:hypothetical protein
MKTIIFTIFFGTISALCGQEVNRNEPLPDKVGRLYDSGIHLSDSEGRWVRKSGEPIIRVSNLNQEVPRLVHDIRKRYIENHDDRRIKDIITDISVYGDSNLVLRVIQVTVFYAPKNSSLSGVPLCSGFLIRPDGKIIER